MPYFRHISFFLTIKKHPFSLIKTMAKKSNTEIGRQGELQALALLVSKGYEILETNYRYKRSEIDIIASCNNTIVFVEVKFRKGIFFGNPEEFVSDAQAERVHAAAEQYIFDKNWNRNIRFDIVAIIAGSEVLHIEDAF